MNENRGAHRKRELENNIEAENMVRAAALSGAGLGSRGPSGNRPDFSAGVVARARRPHPLTG